MRTLIALIVLAGLVAGCTDEPATAVAQDREGLAPASSAPCPDLGLSFELTGCENSPGSEISLSGVASWNGLGARLIFSNASGPGPHVREEIVLETVLVQAGEITFEKEPVDGGVGGNPWIWIEWIDGDGNPIAPRELLGRCVQSGK